MSSTDDRGNPILMYLTETYSGDPSGVFAHPRQDAYFGARAADFIKLFARLPANKIKKETFQESQVSYLDIDFDIKETVSAEMVLDAIKYIAVRVSDRHYSFIKNYFETFTFLAPGHEFAGAPVMIKRGKGYASNLSLVSSRDILGAEDDPVHPIPALDDFKLHPKLPETMNHALRDFELSKGFSFNTKQLRTAIGLDYLAQYQMQFLYNFSRYNYMAACRRSGKSFLAAYICIRHLFEKDRTILYAVPNESYYFQPMTYFQRLVAGVAEFDKNIRVSLSDNTLRNRGTGSIIKLVSGKMAHGIRSFDADGIVIDEADFFPEKEFTNLATIIEQKFDQDPLAFFMAMSTIDPEKAKKGEESWFYKELIDCEISDDPEKFAMRVPITKNEFYSERARKAMIDKYKRKNDEIGMRCELFAEYPPTNTQVAADFFPIALKAVDVAASTGDQIRQALIALYVPEERKSAPEYILFSYDPAGNTSGSVSALSVGMVHEGTGSEKRRRLTLLAPIPLPRSALFAQKQLPEIMAHIEQVHKAYPRTKIIFNLDINGVGLPLYELVEIGFKGMREKYPTLNLESFPVRYVSNAKAAERRVYMDNGEIKGKKEFIVQLIEKLSQDGTINAVHHPILEQAMSASSLGNLKKLNDYLSTIMQIVAVVQYIDPMRIEEEVEDIKKTLSDNQVNMIRQMMAPWQLRNNQKGSVQRRMSTFGY